MGCNCTEPSFGDTCELIRCANDCSDRGKCDAKTGQCRCDAGSVHLPPLALTRALAHARTDTPNAHDPSTMQSAVILLYSRLLLLGFPARTAAT